MLISLIALILFSAPGRAETPCAADLTINSRVEHRSHVRVVVYEFADDPRGRVRLDVTPVETTLGELSQLGLRRRSRAARALGFTGPLEQNLIRPVRLAHLRFKAPLSETKAHQDLNLGIASVREEYEVDFANRRALLAQLAADYRDRNTIYSISFASEPLLWRELEELAYLGLTQFPARTWIAEVLREHGVRGALALEGGGLPEVANPPERGVHRYAFNLARDQNWGPQILLFQPARR